MGQVSKIEEHRQRVGRYSAPVLDDRLSALVAGFRDSTDAVLVDPASAAALQAFVDAQAPPLPDRADIERMLMLLDTVKRRRNASEAEGEAVQELYWLGLKDIALDDLRHAYEVLLKGSPWFPDISEIRKAAQGGPVTRHMRNVVVAKILLRKHREEWREPVETITPEQAREVRRLIEGTFEGMKGEGRD